MKHTSAELKRLSREQLNGHWGLAIGANLIVQMIMSGLLTPFYFLLVITGNGMVQYIIYMIAAIIIAAASMVLQCGILRMYFGFARKQEVSVGMLFSEFTKRPDRYILGYFLMFMIEFICVLPGTICMTVGVSAQTLLAVLIGVVLYIAGAVVMLVVSMSLAQVFMLLVEDSDMGAMEALRRSSELMRGNKGRYFYIYLSFLGWALLGICSCGIGMLWVTPYMMQTNVNFYRDLMGELNQGPYAGPMNSGGQDMRNPNLSDMN